MKTLTHKGYGRIYCETAADVSKVEAVIRELDEFEFSYMPKEFVTVFTNYPSVIFTHKFSDLDMDKLTAVCWGRGIKVWVFDAGDQAMPRNEIQAHDES